MYTSYTKEWFCWRI